MKKKLLSVLLSIAVAATMMPSMAFAANDAVGVDAGGKKVVEKTEELTMKGSGSGDESEKIDVEITDVKIAGIEYNEDYGYYTKTYDGNVVSCEGTPVAKTLDNTKVDIERFTYEWYKYEITSEGEESEYGKYQKVNDAPKAAGDYKLVISVPKDNEKYAGAVALDFRIWKKEIKAVGIKIKNKEYDGNTKADIEELPETLELKGIMAEDDVHVDKGDVSAEFYDKNAKEGKKVKITGYNLAGTDADNYELAIEARADITPKTIKITDGITMEDRAYDGGNWAVGSVDIDKVNGIVDGDSFNIFVSGHMNDYDAGKDKTVTLTYCYTQGYNFGASDYTDDGKNYKIILDKKTAIVNIKKADFKEKIEVEKFIKKTDSPQIESVYFNKYIDIDDANITNVEITEGRDVIENVSAEVDSDEESSNKTVVSFNVKDSAKDGNKAIVALTINSRNYNDFTAVLEIKVTNKPIVGVKFDNIGIIRYGDQRTITASAYDENDNEIRRPDGEWTWKSSNPEILSVTADKNDSSKAVIEGLKADQTGVTITATYTSDSYVGNKSVRGIRVRKRIVVIKPNEIEITVGDEIPQLNNYVEKMDGSDISYIPEAIDGTYTVEGLVNGDSLKGKPSLDYWEAIYYDNGSSGDSSIIPDNTKVGKYTIKSYYREEEDNYYIDKEKNVGTLTIKDRPSPVTPVTPAPTPEKEEPKVEYDADGNKITTETTTDKATGTTTEKIKTEKKDGTVIEQVVVKNDKEGTSSSVTTTKNTDNSTVVETKETKKDGSTIASKKETAADGTVTETAEAVDKTANTVTKSSKVTNADGTYEGTTTTTNADKSKETVVSEKKVNSAKNPIEVTTVTKESADGAKTVEQTSTIQLNDKDKAVVKVNTDAEGNTEATAEVEKTGTKLKSGATKGVIAGSAVDQIKEAAGEGTDVTIKTVIKDAKGKEVFTVTADTEDMKAGNALYILKTGKDGKQTLVNAVKYTVTKNGGVTVSLKVKGNFELVTKAEKNSLVKEIKKTIAPTKKVKTVKKGKKTTMTLKKTLDKANVKSITYKTMNKKVATVNKAGKVTAKKKGTATIKATVTLKDGSYKIVTTKVRVK